MQTIRRTLLALVLVVCAGAVLPTATASASSRDCFSYQYACTPGYTGANASGTWAWRYYGGSYASTPNGYHNCTLYVAWRLAQAGMGDPGHSWGNAVQWAGSIGGGNHTPAVGSIAWYGSEVGGGYGHVAYVEQVSGPNVFIRADNFSTSAGYTDAGWVAASSVDLFLHPHDLPGGGGSSPPPPAPAPFVPGTWNRWNNGDHSALIGTPPSGATFESTLGVLLTTPVKGTRMLYSCSIGGDEFTSPYSSCEGQHVNGALGYIYVSRPSSPPTQAVYRCLTSKGEHFDSPDGNCEGQRRESLLGYAIAYALWNRWNNGDRSALVGPGPVGATYEGTLGALLSVPAPGTRELWSCSIGGDEFTSTVSTCEGQQVNGALGYVYVAKPLTPATRAIYRCITAKGEHFDSPDVNCEGQRRESLLGYAVAYTALNRWVNGDHSAVGGPGPAGATFEGTLGDLLTVSVKGTRLLYSCSIGGDEFTSPYSNCEGQHVNGALGYIYASRPSSPSTRAIYRCLTAKGEHFDSPDVNCEGQRRESLLGYAVAYA